MKNKNYNGLKPKLTLFTCLIVFLGFNYVFSSCASSEIADSGDVNQAKIHQQYSVSYDANNNGSYKIEAQFRFGGNKGTTLRLTEPSKVFVNGIEMNEESNVLQGCFYTLKINEGNTFNFKFIDTDEKEFSNKCKVLKAEPKPITNINTSIDYKIKWIGMPLTNNETIICIIEDNDGNSVSSNSDIIGSDYIQINSEDLTNLIEGSGELYLKRTSTIDAKETGDEGGKIYTEYISKKHTIKIKSKNNVEE